MKEFNKFRKCTKK